MKISRKTFVEICVMVFAVTIIMSISSSAASYQRVLTSIVDDSPKNIEKEVKKVGRYYFGIVNPDIKHCTYSIASYKSASRKGKKTLAKIKFKGEPYLTSYLTNGKKVFYTKPVNASGGKVDVYSVKARGGKRKKVCRISTKGQFVFLMNLYKNKLYYEYYKKDHSWIAMKNLKTGKTKVLFYYGVEDISPNRRYIHYTDENGINVFDCKSDKVVGSVKVSFDNYEIFADKTNGWITVLDETYTKTDVYRYSLTGTQKIEKRASISTDNVVHIDRNYIYYYDINDNCYRYSFSTQKSQKMTIKKFEKALGIFG